MESTIKGGRNPLSHSHQKNQMLLGQTLLLSLLSAPLAVEAANTGPEFCLLATYLNHANKGSSKRKEVEKCINDAAHNFCGSGIPNPWDSNNDICRILRNWNSQPQASALYNAMHAWPYNGNPKNTRYFKDRWAYPLCWELRFNNGLANGYCPR